MTYDAAFSAARKLPEMAAVFAAMSHPALPGATANSAAEEQAAGDRKKAGAQFSGLVAEAAKARVLTWDQAWSAIREEQPHLWAAMGGNKAPSQTHDEMVRKAGDVVVIHQPLKFATTSTRS